MVTAFIKKRIFAARLKKAIDAAIHAHAADGRTYIVIRWGTRPVAIAKSKIKEWINGRRLKGITIGDIEKNALYIAK